MATNQATTTVTSTAAVALAANGARASLIVRNIGNQIVYVDFTGTATVAASLPLFPGEPLQYGGNPPLEAVSVICAAGVTSTVHCVET